MRTLRNYTDTKCELEMAKARLNLLIDKKITIYGKYFPLNAKLKEIHVDGGSGNNDPMVDYMHELTIVDLGTGMSIIEEIDYQQKNIVMLQSYLDSMNESLSKMTGIEYQLFYEIVYNGLSVSKAIEKIAELTDKDTSTIWKYHYKKIKKDVKKITNFENVQ